MSNEKILFVSSGGADHASEELWARTAMELAKQGFSVFASIDGWPPLHWRVRDLRDAGVHLQIRPAHYPLWKRAWNHIFFSAKAKAVLELKKLLRRRAPRLVVFSEGFFKPPIDLIDLCISNNLPFVTVTNGNCEQYCWPVDADADRYRIALSAARRCYFVSNANLRLAEKEIGGELSNAEVVWSQYNVAFNADPPWPSLTSEEELRLACVGRLDPPTKGQDILLEALASPSWKDRRWHLSLYGEGQRRNSLERLIVRLGLSNRVTFAGHVTVEEIWSANHVLIMPSRFEGLPLALVEAMLCGRPVLATDVGGNSEVMIDGVTGFLTAAPTVPILSVGLERVWANRGNLETMGKAGAKRIREIVPAEPICVFSEKIKSLVPSD
jgi:glycosyltransferase involved in cell wall biosynthesis